MLEQFPLSAILFLDVETVPEYPDYESVPPAFRELWDRKAAQLRREEESRLEAEATARFEKSVESLIASGAGDRATAIRWMHEANDTNYDGEYLCYQLGLPYGYLRNDVV